jgi:hypothetical protein
MSWLDSVLATPVIGLQLSPSFSSALSYPSHLSGFLDNLIKSEQTVNFGLVQPAGIQVTLVNTGYVLKFDINNAVADFQYQLKGEQTPGELPAFGSVDLVAYSAIAEKQISLLSQAIIALAEQGSPLKCNRFGLVARVTLASDSLPPGVDALKSQLAGSWNHPLLKLDSTATIRLAENDHWTELCHHKMTYENSVQAKQIRLNLDWQRMFKMPIELTSAETEEFLQIHLTAGLKYFERVADGGYDE